MGTYFLKEVQYLDVAWETKPKPTKCRVDLLAGSQ